MVPWMSEKEIEIIDEFLRPEWVVFEWGCGGSTLRWRDRVKEWISIDHNPEWTRKIPNVILRSYPTEYVLYPLTLGRRFDLVLVDGILRGDCLLVASFVADQALEHDSIRTKASEYWSRAETLVEGEVKGNHRGLRRYWK